jgi:DNA-binding response OmpR family regulator
MRAGAAGVRLLVVDEQGTSIAAELRDVGVEVTCCARGADALVAFGTDTPDAVLIAPELPDVGAPDVVRAMRRYGAKAVLLGVGPSDAEVAGPVLLAGATAAVCRPYDVDEVLGHLAGLPAASARAALTFGSLRLDPAAHTVHLAGRELDPLPLKEFELLQLLLRHADQVVTPTEIRAALWGGAQSSPSPNAITVHAARLRNRLEPPLTLRTVRGLGYRLTLEPAQGSWKT